MRGLDEGDVFTAMKITSDGLFGRRTYSASQIARIWDLEDGCAGRVTWLLAINRRTRTVSKADA